MRGPEPVGIAVRGAPGFGRRVIRLILPFDRRSFGRLRQLIDFIKQL
jgi:hypothetical protein